MSLKSVVYCKVCTLPPEYCEFTGKFKRCKSWLHKSHFDLYSKLYEDADGIEDDGIANVSKNLAKSSIGEAREDELDKKLQKLQAKEESREQREMAKLLSSKVVIKREARTKKKCVITVSGLEVFDIEIKKVAKTFASKFATGCSISKNIEKKEEVIVQGDIADEIKAYIHTLLEDKGLNGVKVEFVDTVRKKKPTNP